MPGSRSSASFPCCWISRARSSLSSTPGRSSSRSRCSPSWSWHPPSPSCAGRSRSRALGLAAAGRGCALHAGPALHCPRHAGLCATCSFSACDSRSESLRSDACPRRPVCPTHCPPLAAAQFWLRHITSCAYAWTGLEVLWVSTLISNFEMTLVAKWIVSDKFGAFSRSAARPCRVIAQTRSRAFWPALPRAILPPSTSQCARTLLKNRNLKQ